MISEETAIFLGDFGENYSFVVQDELQSMHRNNLQCTLHPPVAYYKDNRKLTYKTFCIILDDLKNDVDMVHEVQREIIQNLKSVMPTSKSQAEYLRQRKEMISEETAIFLGDFRENYSFVVQDEVQRIHWNNLQCTLHPAVAYYKDNGKLTYKSFCII